MWRGASSAWTGRKCATLSPRCGCSVPTILPVDLAAHDDALRIAERYGYSIFDALVIASALQAKSEMLWSEDMHHGMVVDGRLRIANPFRKES